MVTNERCKGVWLQYHLSLKQSRLEGDLGHLDMHIPGTDEAVHMNTATTVFSSLELRALEQG